MPENPQPLPLAKVPSWTVGLARMFRRARNSVFHWKHPGVLVGIFVAVALGMFTLGQGAHSRFLVHLGFGVAYLSLLLGVMWGIGAWINSDHWENSHPGLYKWDKDNIKSYRRSQWLGSIGIFVVFAFFVWITVLFHLDKLSSLPRWEPKSEATRRPSGPALPPPTATPPPKGTPKPIASSTPSVGTRLGIGPDAYKDISDKQLAQWAIEEGDKINELINQSNKLALPPELQKLRFTSDFNDCCAQDLKDLRAEILRRLGPPAKDVEEVNTWNVLIANHPDGINRAAFRAYIPYFQRMAVALRKR